MARFLPTALVVALLVGTAAAFAVTERLKLEGPPIAGPDVTAAFAPLCRCEEELATIAFRVLEADRVDVAIVDAGGDVVRRLVDHAPVRARRFSATWDGRDDAGRVVADGTYRPRVRLDNPRRTILLPNPIRVDTVPPRVLEAAASPDGFSPDGDGRNDKVAVGYRFSERAHGVLFLGERRLVRTRGQRPEAKLDWYGRVQGKPLPAGTYELVLAAEDVAGNVGRGAALSVRIRYVEVAPAAVEVVVRRRFTVAVRSDAETVRWRFAGGTGRAEAGRLVLRAPRRPGTYTLFVEANGHGARATVTVRARPAARRG